MNKSKKIILSICTVFIAVFTLCSCFFGFGNDFTQAKADSTYNTSTFISSNIIMSYTGYRTDNSIYNFSDVNTASGEFSFMQYSFKVTNSLPNSSGVYSISPLISGNYDSSHFIGDSINFNALSNVTFNNVSIINGYSFDLFKFLGSYYTAIGFVFDYYNNGVSSFSIDKLPTLNIVSVEIGNFSDVSNLHFDSNSALDSFLTNINYGCYNYVCYTDSNNFRYTFFIPCDIHYKSWSTMSLFYTYRKYYINVDFSDNQIYYQGYNAGLKDNQTNIYNNGYNDGQTVGYNNGYNDGLNATDQYSFFNLFGAVLDAPIHALKGLLDFNIFGVNLLTLFCGLLTLAVILFVMRLIRGGK